MAEGAHQLALPDKLVRRLADLGSGDLGKVHKHFVDPFYGADGSRHHHFLHAAVGSRAYSDASEPYIRQQEGLQLRIFTKRVSHSGQWLLPLAISGVKTRAHAQQPSAAP